MIVGMDLLEHLSTIINFGKKSVTLGEQVVEWENKISETEEKANNLLNAKDDMKIPVYNKEKIKISGESEIVIPINGKYKVGTDIVYFEPENTPDLKIVMSRSIFKKEQSPLVNMINVNRETVRLEKGTLLGHLYPCEEVLIANEMDNKETELDKIRLKVDKILENCDTISNAAKVDLRKILIDFMKAFFADDETDLGSFTEIKHTIDTGNVEPIKIPMRRVPWNKQMEIDRQIDKILTAGVIRPTMSRPPYLKSQKLVMLLLKISNLS